MEASVQVSGRATGCAVALLIFCAGIAVFFLLPVVGCFAGPILCLLAVFIGAKRQKVWRCVECRAIVARG